MVTRLLFTVFVLAIAVQRLLEVRRSGENERRLRARGAREHAPRHFRAMQLLHGAWFAAMLLEVWLLRPAFEPWLALGAGAAFALGQVLRVAAMRALGERWSVRILTLPGEPPVQHGVYRYVRHPNYAGVVLEIAALPLLHGAVYTALGFSLANAALLWLRIREEERALGDDSDYAAHFAARPRFLPRFDASRSRGAP